MFTGIITDVGRVARVEPRADARVIIDTAWDTASIALGSSIACSGPCLTVVDRGPGWFAVDVSAETRARTAAAMWSEGRALNLERALRVGDELGGHIVTGHVDAVGTVEAATPEGGSVRLTIRAPDAIARNVATKGSIAIDGVSLTVNDVVDAPTRFTVNIIPHTAAHSTLGGIAPGDEVNLEIDVLARYLARMTSYTA